MSWASCIFKEKVTGGLVVLEVVLDHSHMCDEVSKLGIKNLPLGKKSSSDNVVAC